MDMTYIKGQHPFLSELKPCQLMHTCIHICMRIQILLDCRAHPIYIHTPELLRHPRSSWCQLFSLSTEGPHMHIKVHKVSPQSARAHKTSSNSLHSFLDHSYSRYKLISEAPSMRNCTKTQQTLCKNGMLRAITVHKSHFHIQFAHTMQRSANEGGKI